MKKILLSITALLSFAIASAQEEGAGPGFTKGDVFASGTISYGTIKIGDDKTDQFVIAPRVGYFINDHIALGVALQYYKYGSDVIDFEGNPGRQKSTVIQAGAFGRYYFNPASVFSLFTELSASYSSSNYEYPGNSDQKRNGFGVALAPGINYFVSNHLSLEAKFALLNYNTSKYDYPGSESTNSFGIGLDLANIGLGLLYKF